MLRLIVEHFCLLQVSLLLLLKSISQLLFNLTTVLQMAGIAFRAVPKVETYR